MKLPKINIPVRLKDPYFWISTVSAILCALHWDISMFTSWDILGDRLKELIGNPYLLTTVIITIIGIVHDPTTEGIGDSELVLSYKSPKDSTKKKELKNIEIDLKK